MLVNSFLTLNQTNDDISAVNFESIFRRDRFDLESVENVFRNKGNSDCQHFVSLPQSFASFLKYIP